MLQGEQIRRAAGQRMGQVLIVLLLHCLPLPML
jgi:hypothetical protein